MCFIQSSKTVEIHIQNVKNGIWKLSTMLWTIVHNIVDIRP